MSRRSDQNGSGMEKAARFLMNALIGRLPRLNIPRRFAPLAFCAIWLGLAAIFLSLAATGRRSMDQRIERAGFRFPPGRDVQVGNFRLQVVINQLAEKHDKTAASLEQSIRRAARTGFWLNLASAFLCLVGFTAQWTGAQGSSDEDRGSAKEQPLDPLQRDGDSNPPARSPTPSPVTHEGCFPGGAYGR